MDKLEEILKAVENRSVLEPEISDAPTIRMISWATFSRSNYKVIRKFQAQVEKRFGIQLVAIGGGYGCSKILFSVHGEDNSTVSRFVRDIMGSEEFRNLGVEAEFRVAINTDPYIRTDLKTGDQDLSSTAKRDRKQYLQVPAKDEPVSQTIQQIIYGDVGSASIETALEKNVTNVTVGDKKSLVEYLVESGIPAGDASEIADIIESEKPVSAKEPFGDRAKTWISENIPKLAGGVWSVGVTAATTMLTQAALQYYGLK